MEDDTRMNWYVLFVMGGKEQSICDFLNLDEELHAFAIQKEVIHKKAGKVITVQRPLFPSYIFVETKAEQKVFQEILKQKRIQKEGIIKELRYEDEVNSLTNSERAYLEGLIDEEYVVKKSVGYVVDDKVVIQEGPLKGYESNIVKIDRHQKKAELEVNISGNVIRAKVSLEIVKKI